VPAGHRVRTIAVGQFPYDFALSPNGRLLAAAVGSGAEIWDVSTGTRIARLSLGKQAGWNVAFSADGSHLVTGGGDGQVRVWDLPAFLPHNVFPTGARAAWSTAFSPSGDRVAAGGQDGRLTIWSVPDGRRLVHVTVSQKPLHMVAFDPHGQSVAVATGSGKDAVLDASSGKRLYTVAAGGNSGSVAFSPDGTKLLTSGYLRRGESVRVWDAATGAREFAKPAPFVQDAVFSPDGGEVAAGGDDGLVRIWRIDNGALVRQLRPGTARHEHVNAVAYSNDGDFLAAGTSAGVVVIWDAHTGNKVATLRGHSNWVDALQFTADGRHLISASDDGTVRLWDWRPNTGATVVSGIDSGTSLGFTDHGSWVSVAMPNKTVYLVHCFACQPLATLEALAAQQARPLSASEERTYLHTGESLSSRPY
jgi:WD40 repeat protein